MKIKLKLKSCVISIDRIYAYNLARYRANSLIKHKCTLKHFIRFHEMNSLGEKKYIEKHGVNSLSLYLKNNGWASGQWCSKLTTESVIVDIQNGDFCKYEFTHNGRFRRYWRLALKHVVITKPFFPHLKEYRL